VTQSSGHAARTEVTIFVTSSRSRPVTPDRLPLVGRLVDGLYVATGHFQMGIVSAPATSLALYELLLHGRSSLPIDAFSPDRFSQPSGIQRNDGFRED